MKVQLIGAAANQSWTPGQAALRSCSHGSATQSLTALPALERSPAPRDQPGWPPDISAPQGERWGERPLGARLGWGNHPHLSALLINMRHTHWAHLLHFRGPVQETLLLDYAWWEGETESQAEVPVQFESVLAVERRGAGFSLSE